mgnify:CR=1 FL=1
MEEKPNYYSIIPADVRYDTNLTSTEKLLYGEITSLTQKTGECWASNKYFANLYDVEPQSISRMIKHLTEREHITYRIVYKENKKEIEKRNKTRKDAFIIAFLNGEKINTGKAIEMFKKQKGTK